MAGRCELAGPPGFRGFRPDSRERPGSPDGGKLGSVVAGRGVKGAGGGRSVEERSAGGVVLRFSERGPLALVIRDPYEKWGLPKGHVEDGEDLGQTALREVREETGLHELELGVELGTIDWWFRDDDLRIHKFCTFFLMASARGEPVPERAEGITECRWLPLRDAPAGITYGNARRIVREAVRRYAGGETGLPGLGEEPVWP